MILYKVVNSEGDKDDPSFNAFSMPRGRGPPTLATVKQYVGYEYDTYERLSFPCLGL